MTKARLSRRRRPLTHLAARDPAPPVVDKITDAQYEVLVRCPRCNQAALKEEDCFELGMRCPVKRCFCCGHVVTRPMKSLSPSLAEATRRAPSRRVPAAPRPKKKDKGSRGDGHGGQRGISRRPGTSGRDLLRMCEAVGPDGVGLVSQEELAEREGVSVTTIKRRIARARASRNRERGGGEA